MTVRDYARTAAGYVGRGLMVVVGVFVQSPIPFAVVLLALTVLDYDAMREALLDNVVLSLFGLGLLWAGVLYLAGKFAGIGPLAEVGATNGRQRDRTGGTAVAKLRRLSELAQEWRQTAEILLLSVRPLGYFIAFVAVLGLAGAALGAIIAYPFAWIGAQAFGAREEDLLWLGSWLGAAYLVFRQAPAMMNENFKTRDLVHRSVKEQYPPVRGALPRTGDNLVLAHEVKAFGDCVQRLGATPLEALPVSELPYPKGRIARRLLEEVRARHDRGEDSSDLEVLLHALAYYQSTIRRRTGLPGNAALAFGRMRRPEDVSELSRRLVEEDDASNRPNPHSTVGATANELAEEILAEESKLLDYAQRIKTDPDPDKLAAEVERWLT